MPNLGPIEVGLTIGWIVVVILLLYALVVLGHEWRKVIHFDVTTRLAGGPNH